MAVIPHPTDVELDSAAGVLSVQWSDQVHTDYSVQFLRGWCPCATCQGHFSGGLVFKDVKPVQILDVEPVGSYGVKIEFSDGHTTGIYSFKYLRDIYAQPPAEGPSNLEMLGRSALS